MCYFCFSIFETICKKCRANVERRPCMKKPIPPPWRIEFWAICNPLVTGWSCWDQPYQVGSETTLLVHGPCCATMLRPCENGAFRFASSTTHTPPATRRPLSIWRIFASYYVRKKNWWGCKRPPLCIGHPFWDRPKPRSCIPWIGPIRILPHRIPKWAFQRTRASSLSPSNPWTG